MLAPRTQSNLRFSIRVSDLPASSRGTRNGFSPPLEEVPHTYASAAFCRTPPLGSGGVAPGHSREFPTFSLGTSWGCISLTRYLNGVFCSLLGSRSLFLSNGIRHALFRHWNVFFCYFSVSDPAVNFQRN